MHELPQFPEVDRGLLELLIQAAPVGFALVDHEFRYLRVNQRLAAMNMLPAADHLGRTAYELFPGLVERWEPLWRQVLATGEPVLDQELMATLDGQLYSARVSYYPVRAGDGPILGVGIMVEETTEQRRLYELAQQSLAAEQAARTQAEVALRMRDAFLSVAAHELKNPLASLLGQAQLARRRGVAEGISEAMGRALEVISDQALRLSRMIDDLLDLSQLERGKLNLVYTSLDVVALARRVTAEAAAAGGKARVSFHSEVAGLTLTGDAARLEQVIGNLVGNARKYSPAGGSICVGLGREGQWARLTVRDEGIGIPPEALSRLFEPFYRGPNAEALHIGGFGIGLSIVHEIVTRHGGTIGVTSEVGYGSTFTVRLPLPEAEVQ